MALTDLEHDVEEAVILWHTSMCQTQCLRVGYKDGRNERMTATVTVR